MKQLETALINADKAGDSEGARMLAAEIVRMRQQTSPPPMSRGEAGVLGFERGMKPVAEFARKFDPLAYLIDAAGIGAGTRDRIEQQLSAAAAQAQQQRPNAFLAGKIGGEIAATAPMIATGGGALARGGRLLGEFAPAVKPVARVIEQFGKSVKTGGIGVKAPSRAAATKGAPMAASKKGRVALRVAGGAGAGAAGAAMTDQDAFDATVVGGAFPIVANVGKHGLGYVFDKLSGRFDKVQAGQIIRNLIADKSSGILEALATASKDVKANTAEFLAERGLLTPELAAATRIVSGGKASKPLEDVALARAAGQNAMRQQMMGADTQTGAVANIREAKKQVRMDTEQQRVAALGRADVGRTQILPAERESARLAQLATDEAATARRLLSGAERQTGRLGEMNELNQMRQSEIDFGYRDNTLGIDFPQGTINRQGDVIAGLERFGGEAADRSLVAGQDSRSAAEVAANLRAQGLAPLDISDVVGRLRQQASDAEFVSPDRANVFSAFADALERRAAKFGGVIDAAGLHLARREMGQFVANTLKGSDPQSIRLGTSQLIGEAQPLIDKAIRDAGGEGWGAYLDAFSQGMRKVEQQDFGRKLAALPEARLNKIMSGQDEEFVEDFFGPGRFDINVEYFSKDLPTAQKLSGEIGATRNVAQSGLGDLAASQRLGLPAGARARAEDAMAPGTANFMVQGLARIMGGFPGLYGGGQFASQAEEALANKLRANTMQQLAPGLASPSQALRLSNTRPAYDFIDLGFGQVPQSLLDIAPRTAVSGALMENKGPAKESRNRMRR
jgi:hypothetical protein